MLKISLLFKKKIQNLWVNNSIILKIRNVKLSGYYFYMNLDIWGDFHICISVPLRIYLYEKLNFYDHILVRNAQMHIRIFIFPINHNRHQLYSINHNAKFTQCAETFKPHYIGTYTFFLTPKFLMIGLHQSKYRLGSVNIGLDRLISVQMD